MRDITEDEIRSAFGEKTFLRGLRYFENGHVEMRVKKGDNLTGTVQGSMQYPYRVEIDIEDNIYCRCTCPVGAMCKHGVALLLQWINDNDSFVDADDLLASLQKRSKEELYEIISSMLEDSPALVSKLAFSEKVREKKIDMEVIAKRLDHIGRGFFDYYAVSGVAKELEDIKEIGDTLAEEGCFSDAVEVYLTLIEWGVNAFENGVDDSDGALSDIVYCCVEDFTKIAEKLEEEQKRDLIDRILNIMEGEDYGLETDELLYGLATKENISVIEEELLKRIPRGESFHVEYYKRSIVDLLSNLYSELGMQQDALRVIKEGGLESADDHILLAKILMNQDEHEKAFNIIREGMRIEEDRLDIRLDDLYLALLHRFLLEENRGIDVDVEEAIIVALHALSHPFYFDSGRYAIMKDIFERMGEYNRFISAIKRGCEENIVIEMLLHENRIEEAIEHALSSPTLYALMLIEVAEAAKEKGKTEAAHKLTLKALNQGLVSADAPVNELIRLVVAESDESELKEAVDSIRNVSIARLFADALMEKNQAYAVIVLKRFIRGIKKKELLRYVANLEDVYAKEICRVWISEVINRSHVYYDDAVDILKTLKGMTTEEEWVTYISTFVEKNRGKKKLLEKVEAALFQETS